MIKSILRKERERGTNTAELPTKGFTQRDRTEIAMGFRTLTQKTYSQQDRGFREQTRDAYLSCIDLGLFH